MNQKKSHPRKPNTGLKGVKYVMLTVGLTSILGFWGLFARQAAAAGAAAGAASNTGPGTRQSRHFNLNPA